MSDAATTPPDDPVESARAMGLRYVNDCEPGIRRERIDGPDGPFRYRRENGDLVTGPRILARIEALRIPPAWEEVWICAQGNGHLQGVTGHNTIPKNGQIEFPTLTDGVRVNDNSLVSQVVEEDAAHGTSGGTIHDSGAFS